MILPKLGIDQSKDYFDACLLCGDMVRKRKFSNDEKGFRALTSWLIGLNAPLVHLCLEATGRYGNKLAEYCFNNGHQVSMVNPARIVAFRESKGKRHKTDQGDAALIADYAASNKLREWAPAPAHVAELRDIVGQIALLKKHRTAYTNRSKCGLVSDRILSMNRELAADLGKHIAKLQREARAIVQSDEHLRALYAILDSVPGLGEATSMALLAQVDFKQFRTGRDLAVFLGLSPKLSQSGTTENRSWHAKQGDPGLRALLRMGATSAKRGKFYKPFVERLMQKGKKKGAVTIAVARKMLLIAHACIRRNEKFDPSFLHPLAMPA